MSTIIAEPIRDAATRFRPAVPPPLRQPMGLRDFLRHGRKNLITTLMEAHFDNGANSIQEARKRARREQRSRAYRSAPGAE